MLEEGFRKKSRLKERGFNNIRKYGVVFWRHRRVKKTGA